MNYWFTADLHLNHKNIIKYCNRPFNNVEEMNNTILNNLYDSVKKSDILYILGDFSFEFHYYEELKRYALLNKFEVIFIKGNHDTDKFKEYYKSHIKNIKVHDQKITLCHYPMIGWEKSHFNSWLLYGHVHDNPIPLQGKLMNVGVDVNNFYPVNFEQIREYMNKQPNNYNYIPENKRRQ